MLSKIFTLSIEKKISSVESEINSPIRNYFIFGRFGSLPVPELLFLVLSLHARNKIILVIIHGIVPHYSLARVSITFTLAR